MSHLQALATTARPAGSAAAADALSYCADHLRSLGFTVAERPFVFSGLPGRFGAPILGGVASVMLAAAAFLGAGGQNAESAQVLAVTLAVTIWLARWLGGPDAIVSRFARAEATNLEATRGLEPRVWLIAHIDSKSQPVSTAIRTTGILLLTLAMAGVIVALTLDSAAGVTVAPAAWIAIAIVSVCGGAPLVASTVGSRSHGAADNASSVAAVLEAVALTSPKTSFGVLITDGEELALAGARAWVRGRGPATAINCDTVDDGGHFVVMRYGDSESLAQRANDAARREDPAARVIRPIPGVLTDSVAFHQMGWPTVTLSRGTLRTLNRIHTRRDNLHSMSGTGIPAAARILARLVEELA